MKASARTTKPVQRAIKPVLFVTGHAPPDRIGAFVRLHEREGIELALFGGRSRHGPAAPGAPSQSALPVPHRRVRQRDTGRLAASGRYRAVVCSTAGRVAPLATWAGARRARAPLILWASLWAHPRSPIQLLGYPALSRLYRSADAVVTYGPHVSAYVAARGARNVHVASQAVDNGFWSAAASTSPPDPQPQPQHDAPSHAWPQHALDPAQPQHASDPAWPQQVKMRFLFVGRPAREKGSQTLIEAWSRSRLRPPQAALALVGVGASAWPQGRGDGVVAGMGGGVAGVNRMDPVAPERLREIYASADVLVVPSLATATFREPWGLVINEAMNQKVAVICSDAVGAAAGGLVRPRRNGVIVPAGDRDALAHALRRLADDADLCARLGAAGTADVKAYTYEAWATGFSEALASVGLSRQHC